jgi:nucleotide-binding universal stress UspA family protein
VTVAALMVNVDCDQSTGARIKLAAELARRFDSLLIGIAGWPLVKQPREDGPRDSVEWVSNELEKLEVKFREVAGKITGRLEWRSSMSFPREVIATEARAADLVVIGQSFLPGDIGHTYDPGTIILAAGRPVLVVPRGMDHLESPSVLIAWKDTREARRAVQDALPFLQWSKDVVIAAVHSSGSPSVDRQLSDVARYLERHDVSVRKEIVAVSNENEADMLLELTIEEHADVIVAGAYGRTRLGEWIFGGVTRNLLRSSCICCLLSN